MAYGLQNAMQQDKRESLLAILRDVSPNTSNYFVSNLQRAADATQELHQWAVYNTTRPTSVTTVIDGASATYGDLNTPTKSSNYTAIVSEPVKVSGGAAANTIITKEDPMAFQKDRALKRLKAKMEWLTVNGTITAGATNTAAVLGSIDFCITTNVTARASGQSFTETELNDILQNSWDAVGSEYVADLLVVPMVISRRISGFSANLTRNIDASEKRLVNQVRVYDSQVGQTVKILPHKDVRSAAGTLTVLAVREELFAHSFKTGREPFWKDLASDGDYEAGQYLTEFTVVSFAEKASVKRTGYNIAA